MHRNDQQKANVRSTTEVVCKIVMGAPPKKYSRESVEPWSFFWPLTRTVFQWREQ